MGWVLLATVGGILGYLILRKSVSAPVSAPGGSGAVARQASGSIESPPMIMNGVVRFHAKQRYRMRYNSAIFDPGKLSGLTVEHIYTDASALPADWPKDLATRSDLKTQWAVGTWTGAEETRTDSAVGGSIYGLNQIWPTNSELT